MANTYRLEAFRIKDGPTHLDRTQIGRSVTSTDPIVEFLVYRGGSPIPLRERGVAETLVCAFGPKLKKELKENPSQSMATKQIIV